MSEEGVRGFREKVRRVLQAAAVEAYGRPGAYVTRDRVMGRANITDPQEFRVIAQYLEGRGRIAGCAVGYEVFVLTVEGLDEAMK